MQEQPIFNPHHIRLNTNIFESPVFQNGIFLVKRRSIKYVVVDQYAFVVSGKYLCYFDNSWKEPRVVHKTNIGIHADPYVESDWEIVQKIPDDQIPMAVFRTKLTLNDQYDLLIDNCEHWARFITTGRKESSQVQNAVVLGGLGILLYLASRDDH